MRTRVVHTFLVEPVAAIVTGYHVVNLFWKSALAAGLNCDTVVLSLVHNWTTLCVCESCQLTILKA